MKKSSFFSSLQVGLFFILSFSAFLFAFSLPYASAATWYVRAEAIQGGDGTSWTYAFNNIQDAINAASIDDRIFVKHGVYELDSTLILNNKNFLHIYGGFRGLHTETLPEHANPMENETIIDGQGNVRCMEISGDAIGLLIDGFIFQNGRADYESTLDNYGAAIRILGGSGSPTIQNSIFRNNVAGRGGGAIRVENRNVYFKNCVFWKNRIDWKGTPVGSGGAIAVSSSTSFQHVSFFTNCVFYDNRAIHGGAISNTGAALTLWNSILWGNTAWEGEQIYTWGQGTSSSTYLEHTNIQGGSSGAHGGFFSTSPGSIINSDPRWAGPDVGNFRLRETSPCIDAGGENIHLPEKDLFGGERVVDGNQDGSAIVDMGVHEFIPGEFTFGRWYVDGTVSASGEGLSWGDAFKTINEGIDAAQPGDEVWVRTGVYEPTARIRLLKPITVYGGFAGGESSIAQRNLENNPVVIQGSPSGAPISEYHYTIDFFGAQTPLHAVLDGLTIKNAVYEWGAVRTVEGVLITDCIFEGNVLGVDAGPGSIIRSSSFLGNTRGVRVQYSDEKPVIIDGSEFTENINIDGRGAGIFVDTGGSVDVRSSVFKENQANEGAALASRPGLGFTTVTLSNCIFGGENVEDGNIAANNGGALYTFNTNLQITNSAFKNNSAGTGSGGGVFSMNTNASIAGGVFAHNKANRGAGLRLHRQSGTTWTYDIHGVTFINNNAIAGNGGGALVSDANNSASFFNCVFKNNTATDRGGGLAGNASAINSLFIGNYAAQWGGGANLDGGNNVVHCIFHENTADNGAGGGINGYVSVANTIFSDNTSSMGGADIQGASVSYSRTTQGSLAGTDGNIDDDPLFVDAAGGNFRLQETSPCINAGTLDPPGGLPPTDIEGNPRPAHGTMPDMGAYEHFTATTYTLTVSSGEGGSVTVPGEGDFTYPHGTAVDIEAIAQEGYSFVEWTGTAVDAGKVNDPFSATTTVTMDGDYAVTATFSSIQYNLIVIGGSGGGTYSAGTEVRIQADDPAEGKMFDKWTGDTTYVADVNSASTTVTMPAADVSLTATYTDLSPVTYTLTVRSTGASNVFITSSPSGFEGTTDYTKQSISSGTHITLSAPATSGEAAFNSWTGCDSTNQSDRTCTVTMNANRTVTAQYDSDTSLTLPGVMMLLLDDDE